MAEFIQSNVIERAKLVKAMEEDADVAVACRAICKASVIDFANMFGWVYDPRPGKEHHIPLKLFPHQEMMLEWVNRRFDRAEDGLVEKSRDMGVTWAYSLWIVWKWLFFEDFDALVGSRKEELVDNKLPDSIFGKMEYIINHLPPYLLPNGYETHKHRLYMKLVNPELSNTIIGESTNPHFSRSGRYSVIFLDEFAFVERSQSIWQACGDSSPCRFPVSTPNGKGNKFADLALNSIIPKLTLHWSLHPFKDDAWYESEKKRRTEDEVAQELDISYTRSQRGRVYGGEWDQLTNDKRCTLVPYDPSLPVSTSWDFGIGDATAIGFYQTTRAGAVRLFDYYENSGYGIDHYIKVVQGKPYRYFKHYGDISIKSRELGTGRSVWELLRGAGIRIIGRKVGKKNDAINATKMLLPKLYIDEHLTKFIDAIENYHYAWDEMNNQFHEEPNHDWSCVSPDTKVRTLRGWEPISTIKPGTWVWSYDTNVHRLIPTRCGFVGATKKGAATLEVGLDNGKSIVCTPDHQFMTRDEGWMRADELSAGESLMPFYEVLNRGYLQIDLNDGTFADEHKYVYTYVNGPHDQTKHVDHINGNKHDNDPSNLQLLGHREHVSKTFKGVANGSRHLVAKTPSGREVYGREGLWRFCNYCNEEYYGNYKTWYCSKECLLSERNRSLREKMKDPKNREARNSLARAMYKKRMNHKVRFIKPGPVLDVWDMEVPETHNFIAEGVVIHNSHALDQLSYFAINYKETETTRWQPPKIRNKDPYAITTY